MNTDDIVNQIEVSIEEVKIKIERKDNFLKLINRPEFKKVIEDGYFLNYSSNLIGLLAARGNESSEVQERINKQLYAISCLREYFNSIIKVGNEAEKSLKEHEAMREEVLNEGIE